MICQNNFELIKEAKKRRVSCFSPKACPIQITKTTHINMPNQNDFYISRTRFGLEDQIIDSYELMTNIVAGFEGQASFVIKLDNKLPIIKGNPSYIEETFKDFILKASEQFKDHNKEIIIVHIKNPKSWIFDFIIKDIQLKNHEITETISIDSVSEYNISIPKKIY